MARVKQQRLKLGLNPAREYEETVVYINYDNRDEGRSYYSGGRSLQEGRFFIKLPELVADSLGIKEVRDQSQESVMKKFWDAIKQFKCMKQEKRKVIVYQISVGPDPTLSSSMQFMNRHYGHGLMVKVWADTFEETVAIAGDGVTKRYSYEHIEGPLNYPNTDTHITSRAGDRQDSQVPWTEENEKFFLWIRDGMQTLIDKLIEIKKPEELELFINAGRLLPIGSSS